MARVDVLDLFSYYNIKIVLRGQEAQFSCPFHNDSDPSASVNIITGKWTCYTCKIGGSAIDFVSQLEGWTSLRTEHWVRDRYGGFIKPKSLVEEVENFLKSVKTTRYSDNILNQFKKKTDYWFSRGLNEETIKRFELGYDPRTKRGTIPIRDLDGCLIGVQGRAVKKGALGKYVFIYNLPKQRHIYGIHLIDSNWVVVTEGVIPVMKLHQMGIPAVSTLGSAVSRQQAQVLSSFDKVYMLYDNDDAGWLGMLGNVEKRRFKSSAWYQINTRVYIPQSEDYNDVDEMDANQIRELLGSSLNAQVHVPLSICKAFND